MPKSAMILSTQQSFIERLQGLLSQAQLEMMVAANDKELMKHLQDEKEICLCILDYDSFSTPQAITKIKVKNPEAALLIVASKATLSKMNQQFSNSPQLVKVAWEADDTIVLNHLNRLAHISQRSKENKNDLCPLTFKLLGNSEFAPCDIYVKLSDEKFLKIFHKDDPIVKDDLDKYMVKENSILYIKLTDYERITTAVGEQILDVLERTPFDPQRWALLAQFGQQSSLQLICRLGITEKTLSMVENTLTSIDKIVTSNASLKNVFAALSRDSYNASHGVALAILLAQMSQNCEKTLEKSYSDKFTFAAIFHDIALPDDKLCLIQKQSKPQFSQLNSKQQKMILDHPMLALEKLNKVRGLPADVDKIIEQHHELPDGKGFPRGLNYSRLHYLSCFFIVAHHFIDLMLQGNDSAHHINTIMNEFKSTYHQDNFVDAVQALEKTLGPFLLAPDTQGHEVKKLKSA